jgi:hypothetical protein
MNNCKHNKLINDGKGNFSCLTCRYRIGNAYEALVHMEILNNQQQAEIERLKAKVKEWTWMQEYAGARLTCRFCGVMKGKYHDMNCLVMNIETTGGNQ